MLRALTVTSLFLLCTAPAMAHIVAAPDSAKSGAWFRTDLRVSHGCNGSDTTKITVTVPPEIETFDVSVMSMVRVSVAPIKRVRKAPSLPKYVCVEPSLIVMAPAPAKMSSLKVRTSLALAELELFE